MTAILVVALVCALAMGGLVWAVRAHTRRQLDDARAQARRWVERLGGELLVLDSAAPSGWRRWSPLGWSEPCSCLLPVPTAVTIPRLRAGYGEEGIDSCTDRA
jgi:hypothetical protein